MVANKRDSILSFIRPGESTPQKSCGVLTYQCNVLSVRLGPAMSDMTACLSVKLLSHDKIFPSDAPSAQHRGHMGPNVGYSVTPASGT